MSCKDNASDGERLRVTSAGVGMPYSVLTPERIRLMRSLHDDPSGTSVFEKVGLPVNRARAEIAALVTAGLVEAHAGEYRPTFLVADDVETRRVTVHAQDCGHQLAGVLLDRWDDVQLCYERLHLSCELSLRDAAFLLVGDRVLDVGLLAALARDATMMPAAPARPRPDCSGARYYCWMIEGDYDQLGSYGQRVIGHLRATWLLVTFGRYWIHGMPNDVRSSFEAIARNELANHEDPFSLAGSLVIPAFDKFEADLWTEATVTWADCLLLVYKQNESRLRQLYRTLRAALYLPHGFGEFLCWYDHLAYASAIDSLAVARVLSIPESRYTAALWNEKPASAAF